MFNILALPHSWPPFLRPTMNGLNSPRNGGVNDLIAPFGAYKIISFYFALSSSADINLFIFWFRQLENARSVSFSLEPPDLVRPFGQDHEDATFIGAAELNSIRLNGPMPSTLSSMTYPGSISSAESNFLVLRAPSRWLKSTSSGWLFILGNLVFICVMLIHVIAWRKSGRKTIMRKIVHLCLLLKNFIK